MNGIDKNGLATIWERANALFCSQEQVESYLTAIGISVTGLYRKQTPSTQLLSSDAGFDLSDVQRMWIDGELITPKLTNVFGVDTYHPVWVAFLGNAIPEYAFKATDIESARIGGLITSIGNNSFENSTNLTTLHIGAGITEIGDYAFNGCTNITLVKCYCETPPTLGTDTFNNIDANCMLLVPSDKVNLYQSDANWNSYFNGNISSL